MNPVVTIAANSALPILAPYTAGCLVKRFAEKAFGEHDKLNKGLGTITFVATVYGVATFTGSVTSFL